MRIRWTSLRQCWHRSLKVPFAPVLPCRCGHFYESLPMYDKYCCLRIFEFLKLFHHQILQLKYLQTYFLRITNISLVDLPLFVGGNSHLTSIWFWARRRRRTYFYTSLSTLLICSATDRTFLLFIAVALPTNQAKTRRHPTMSREYQVLRPCICLGS